LYRLQLLGDAVTLRATALTDDPNPIVRHVHKRQHRATRYTWCMESPVRQHWPQRIRSLRVADDIEGMDSARHHDTDRK
jgi:hypothetical protein